MILSAAVEALRERFGKYHVLEKIAQGGMAEVYKVKTIGIAGFEKVQALKRILPQQAREGRFIRSFIDEARIAVELTHRNIVQVFDFGIARATFSSALERRRLRGKPRYMAPEQTLGEPPTAAADVFALGIIAWEMFTAMPLYRGSDIKSILEAVRKTDPVRIDRMNP